MPVFVSAYSGYTLGFTITSPCLSPEFLWVSVSSYLFYSVEIFVRIFVLHYYFDHFELRWEWENEIDAINLDFLKGFRIFIELNISWELKFILNAKSSLQNCMYCINILLCMCIFCCKNTHTHTHIEKDSERNTPKHLPWLSLDLWIG